MGMRRLRLVVMVLCALTSIAGQSRATPVAWLGPACAASKGRFESRLAALASPRELARVSGNVSIRAGRGKLSLQLELTLADQPLGERRFEVKDCAEAAELAAVAIGMAAAPAGESAATGAEPPPVEPPANEAPREPSDERASPPRRPAAQHELELRLGVLGLLELGILPDPAWGASAELGFGVGRRWSLALLGSASLAQEFVLPGGKLTRLSLVSAILRGCARILSRDAIGLDACAGLEGIWSHGEGEGFDVNHSAAFLQLAPHVAADFSLEAPRHLEWHAELGASVPLTRPRFLAEQREVSRAWPLLPAARLGPIVRF